MVPPFDQAASDVALAAFLADRSPQKRARLTEANLRQVFLILIRMSGRAHPMRLRERLAVGVLGLMEAVDTYDPSKNTKFSTHAYHCTRNALLNDARSEKYRDRRFGVSFSELETESDDGEMEFDAPSFGLTPYQVASHRDAERNRIRRSELLRAFKVAMPGKKWRKYRVAIYLSYLRGVTGACTAKLFGLSVARIYQLNAGGLRMLQQYLENFRLLEKWGERYRDWIDARELAMNQLIRP